MLIKYADSPEGEAGDNEEYITGHGGKSSEGDSEEKSKGCRLYLQSRGRVTLLRATMAAADQDTSRSRSPCNEDDSPRSKLPREWRDALSLGNLKARRTAFLEDIQRHKDNQEKFFSSAKHGR